MTATAKKTQKSQMTRTLFGQPRIHGTRRSKHNQAVSHTDAVSTRVSWGGGVAVNENDDCFVQHENHGDKQTHVKVDETVLPDGTKMTFFARKENGPTLDEVMDGVYEVASEALVRKLSQ